MNFTDGLWNDFIKSGSIEAYIKYFDALEIAKENPVIEEYPNANKNNRDSNKGTDDIRER